MYRLHTEFGFTDSVLQWFSSCLTDRTHYVSLSSHCYVFAPVHSGVHQCSVLCPMLFTICIKPLSAIIDSHSITHHSFSDDLQLQMSAPPNRISDLLLLHHVSLTCCIENHRTPATLAPAHTPCLFSIVLHTLRQHLVIVHFLLLLLSGSLFKMMSGVPHLCHHL